jgi:hypothetical protein
MDRSCLVYYQVLFVIQLDEDGLCLSESKWLLLHNE